MDCIQLLALLLKDGRVTTYSLLDGAQAVDAVDYLEKEPAVKVYRLLGEGDSAKFGPILVLHKNGTVCPVLARLASDEGSSSYLSILQYGGEVSSLCKQLAYLADVVHYDGSRWVMRYYDPRLLTAWASVLDRNQRSIAFGGLDAWHFIGLDGVPNSIPVSRGLDVDKDHMHPMLFSESQCAALLDYSAPLMLMNLISQERGCEIWRRDERDRYGFVNRVLGHAQSIGLDDFSEQKTFILLALAYGELFHTSTAFRTMWADRGAMNLNSCIAKIHPDMMKEFGTVDEKYY